MSFVGDLVGDVFGGKVEQEATKVTTQNIDPPAYAKPYLERVLKEAQANYETPREFFGGQTFVDFDPLTTEAIGLGVDRARAGSPFADASRDAMLQGLDFRNAGMPFLMQTARGDFLDRQNPFLDAAVGRATDKVQGLMSQAGRLGSTANLTALTDAVAPIYRDDYERERARQHEAQRLLGGLSQADAGIRQQAAQLAPQVAASDYDDISRLAGFGGILEGKAQEALADEINRFNFLQGERDAALNRFAALTQGSTIGQAGTTTEPIFGNPTARGFGTLASLVGASGMAAQGFGGKPKP
jgi:hypothetical protein